MYKHTDHCTRLIINQLYRHMQTNYVSLSWTCRFQQPSPVKKERSPRPQSFCHSSSVSPQEKLSLPGYLGHKDKQRLSYGAFANPVCSTSIDQPSSPGTDGPTVVIKSTTKGTAEHTACKTIRASLTDVISQCWFHRFFSHLWKSYQLSATTHFRSLPPPYEILWFLFMLFTYFKIKI